MIKRKRHDIKQSLIFGGPFDQGLDSQAEISFDSGDFFTFSCLIYFYLENLSCEFFSCTFFSSLFSVLVTAPQQLASTTRNYSFLKPKQHPENSTISLIGTHY